MIIRDDGFIPHLKSKHEVRSYIEAILRPYLFFELINLFGPSCIKNLPSLNAIASNGLDLDLYCNVSALKNPRRKMQDVPTGIIFGKNFLASYFISYNNPFTLQRY